MLTVDESIRAVLAEVRVGEPETVLLSDSLGRILASTLQTPHDSPPFDKSLMDGFAVSRQIESTDPSGLLPSGLLTLQVIETVTAGTLATQTLRSGTAVRIMTGAPLPAGTTCVVPIERTQFDESRPDVVRIDPAEIRPEGHVLRQGAAARAGTPLLTAGSRISPQRLAALAEFGIGQMTVQRRPRVAILATGNELVTGDQRLQPGQIRNSNEPMLAAQTSQVDGLPVPLGIARDEASELSQRIQEGLQYDMLLLTGGVSAGTLDLVPARLAAAGVRPVFHGIRMKPGKPLWFGVLDGGSRRCLVFGLPGNPVSSLVCFELYVRTAIRRFLGQPQPGPLKSCGRLTEGTVVRGDRPVYHPARVTLTDNVLRATLIPWSGSSDLRATVEANGMVLLQPELGQYTKETPVDIFLWTADQPGLAPGPW